MAGQPTPSAAGDRPHAPAPVPARRLVAYYATLIVLLAAVAGVVVALGADKEPLPAIAGGYDTPDPCLGAQFDVRQSGQFVDVGNLGETLEGRLRLRDRHLTGEVRCVDDRRLEIDARVRDPGIDGTLGGRRFTAERRRDPPDPAAPAPRAPGGVAGEYRVSPASGCLGEELTLEGGSSLEVIAGERRAGRVRYADGRLTGSVACSGGGSARISGQAVDRNLNLTIAGPGGRLERATATKQREPESRFAAFFLAVAVVMVLARLTGSLMPRIGQPRVMGEVLAGILLGPTMLGELAPDIQAALFPSDIVPFIAVAANLGLIFYMFLVGLELDLGQLQGRVAQAAAISNSGVAIPMALGLAVALPVYELVGPDEDFLGFALFMGVAMSITAFPVLARILSERRMLKRPIGALALASAAIDDVTAWFLIALATAVVSAGNAAGVAETVLLAILFTAVMFLGVRRLLARVAVAFDEAGRVPGIWVVAIFASILLAAYVTEEIGIAIIFGAFVLGAVMPRHAGLTEDVTHRIEDFVVTLLLPLFFAYTGLRTDVLQLTRPELLLLTLALTLVAILAKFGGTVLAARVTRIPWRESAVLGTLMNTRGLTELIVLNLALELGVISSALFAALVLMALVTTFMTGPLLRLFDPRNELGAPVEEELEEARRRSQLDLRVTAPARSILVAPQSDAALAQLSALARPLAQSEPPRELILARIVAPPRGAATRGALQTERSILERASTALERVREELVRAGVATRTLALASAEPGRDIVKLASSEEVDLLLVDGRRPLLGGGVPRGEVGTIVAEAPCDVAVLVAREDELPRPGAERPVVVPFGAAEHDWAALELGAWIAAANGAPVRVVGAPGEDGGGEERKIADAALLVRQFTGVPTDAVSAPPGEDGVVRAAAGAGLLVVGLSERWRGEGLGPVRAEIARTAPAPILFVRRGTRPSALAPRDDITRFTWSTPRVGAGGGAGA